MKPVLKAPGTKRLNLKHDGPLSNFGFKFNLRLCAVVPVSLGSRMLLASHCIVLAHAGMDAAEDKLKHPRVTRKPASAAATSAEPAEGDAEEDMFGQEEACVAATRADTTHAAVTRVDTIHAAATRVDTTHAAATRADTAHVAATRADAAHVATSTHAEGAGGLEEGGGCGGLELAAPGDGSAARALTVDGGKVTLDHLGPIVLNADGSLSRITNWDGMTGRVLHSSTSQLTLSRF